MNQKFIKKIFKINKRTKFACGITVAGELFIGILDQPFSMEYYKDSEEMRQFVLSQFETYKNFKW